MMNKNNKKIIGELADTIVKKISEVYGPAVGPNEICSVLASSTLIILGASGRYLGNSIEYMVNTYAAGLKDAVNNKSRKGN